MANANKPQGFELADSEGKQFRTRPYKKAAGGALYRGKVVALNASGLVEAAGATGTILGIALEYKAAADTGDILICDDPEAVFAVMGLGDVQQEDVGINVNQVVGTDSTSLLVAGSSVNMATKATTSTFQFTIIGKEAREENVFGSFCRVLVKPNNHKFKAGVDGI